MIRQFPRATVRDRVQWVGRGLHSGAAVRLTVSPGEGGIIFRYGANRWVASPENVTDTTRCTRLGDISTVEHLMSAFAGLEITDAEVEVDAPELPGLDGSAAEYVAAFQSIGQTPLGERSGPALYRRIFLHEDDGPSAAVAKGHGHWRFEFETGLRWPGTQTFEVKDAVAEYAEKIAPARTFAFSEEVEPLRAMGLGQGLDETSALVLGGAGYVNAARFTDEPARHKLLDLMGDLYLAGVPVRALDVVATRTGHRSNVELARRLSKALFSENPQA